MKKYLDQLWTAFLSYTFFRANPGVKLITLGVGLIAILLAGFSITIGMPTKEGNFAFSFDSAGDVDAVVFTIIFALGALLIAAGLAWLCWEYLKENRKRVIAVEIRGLRDTSGQPLSSAVPKRIKGQRELLLMDIRQGADGDIRSPDDALVVLQSLPHSLRHYERGRDRADISYVAAGLASVPFSFLAGVLFDDESAIEIMDWDRQRENWRELDEADDGQDRLLVSGLDTLGNVQEVVVAVSLSYPVNKPAIAQTFPGMPVVELALSTPSATAHWSADKQSAWAAQFFNLVRHFCGTNVSMIHLVLAAPASVVLRFGRAYDKRNLPKLIVYQYESSQNPQYPWGVLMPVGGVANSEIVRR
jgi:hypothetical protein